MENTKIYIGGGCKEITSQYGSFFNLSLKMEDLKEHVNEKGYINLTINKRKEVGQYGDTHYITLNNWKPEENKTEKRTTVGTNNKSIDISVGDIPF